MKLENFRGVLLSSANIARKLIMFLLFRRGDAKFFMFDLDRTKFNLANNIVQKVYESLKETRIRKV